MKYQLDINISKFSNYELEKIINLDHHVTIDGLDDKFKLAKGKLNIIGYKNENENDVSIFKDNMNIIATVNLDFDYIENDINMIHVDKDKILTTKYSDFDYGEYLVVYIAIDRYEIDFDILRHFENYTAIAGCFGFDVEKHYKILSFKKIKGV